MLLSSKTVQSWGEAAPPQVIARELHPCVPLFYTTAMSHAKMDAGFEQCTPS